jgi:hypothetical protein
MTVKELIKHLEGYNPDDVIAYDLWSIEDVAGFHHGELTREQAEEVLRLMDHNKDCNIGLNWDVMDYYVDRVISEATNKQTN